MYLRRPQAHATTRKAHTNEYLRRNTFTRKNWGRKQLAAASFEKDSRKQSCKLIASDNSAVKAYGKCCIQLPLRRTKADGNTAQFDESVSADPRHTQMNNPFTVAWDKKPPQMPINF
ncbi:hypothetical protein A2U01_0003473 [Trifolium medium]|uniref:Uncharacterized protein n=1 Tax=Trifolium medium TaxID=97028 RepID=A0A392M5I9_9FABA|nr:hypothetical protein [Trifolium medium]